MRMLTLRDRQARQKTKTVPTNVSLDEALVTEARDLGVNISRAATTGLSDAVAKARAERWLADNRTALESSNAFVEEHGLPLQSLRLF